MGKGLSNRLFAKKEKRAKHLERMAIYDERCG